MLRARLPHTRLVSVAMVRRLRQLLFGNLVPYMGLQINISPDANNYVTRTDKRVTTGLFGHSELLIPTESAIKAL